MTVEEPEDDDATPLEERKMRRKHRNRLSAAASRQRKKEWVETLQERLRVLTADNEALRQQLLAPSAQAGAAAGLLAFGGGAPAEAQLIASDRELGRALLAHGLDTAVKIQIHADHLGAAADSAAEGRREWSSSGIGSTSPKRFARAPVAEGTEAERGGRSGAPALAVMSYAGGDTAPPAAPAPTVSPVLTPPEAVSPLQARVLPTELALPPSSGCLLQPPYCIKTSASPSGAIATAMAAPGPGPGLDSTCAIAGAIPIGAVCAQKMGAAFQDRHGGVVGGSTSSIAGAKRGGPMADEGAARLAVGGIAFAAVAQTYSESPSKRARAGSYVSPVPVPSTENGLDVVSALQSLRAPRQSQALCV